MLPDPAWVALSLADHVGGVKMRALLAHFGDDPRAILSASSTELRKVPGIGPKIAQIIRSIDLASVEAAIPRWQAAGVSLLTWDDPAYPRRLKRVDDAPPTLFVRGILPPATSRTVAIVGTRQPSEPSLELTRQLAATLAERGIVVISGLAIGVDTAAHIGTLLAGRTVAVLGSGVLNVYPPANRVLANTILQQGGALVSEVHPSAPANGSSLVARNRLTTGMSDALVIVESSIDGGAMHAARRAREQGRTLYAVNNGASGNRALLDSGAIPLSDTFDNLLREMTNYLTLH